MAADDLDNLFQSFCVTDRLAFDDDFGGALDEIEKKIKSDREKALETRLKAAEEEGAIYDFLTLLGEYLQKYTYGLVGRQKTKKMP